MDVFDIAIPSLCIVGQLGLNNKIKLEMDAEKGFWIDYVPHDKYATYNEEKAIDAENERRAAKLNKYWVEVIKARRANSDISSCQTSVAL